MQIAKDRDKELVAELMPTALLLKQLDQMRGRLSTTADDELVITTKELELVRELLADHGLDKLSKEWPLYRGLNHSSLVKRSAYLNKLP